MPPDTHKEGPKLASWWVWGREGKGFLGTETIHIGKYVLP